MFELHERLNVDCFVVGDFSLSRLLLMNDASYPWFILVPRRAGVREVFEMDAADQQQLCTESSQLARALSKHFKADKINIAALGNMVPQLHIHHIVRYKDDPAWPAPVWGVIESVPYTESDRKQLLSSFTPLLNESFQLAA